MNASKPFRVTVQKFNCNTQALSDKQHLNSRDELDQFLDSTPWPQVLITSEITGAKKLLVQQGDGTWI